MATTNPYLHLTNEKELLSLLRLARAGKDTAKEGLITEALAALTPYHSGFLATTDMSKLALVVTTIQGLVLGSADQKTIVVEETLTAQLAAAATALAPFRGPKPVRVKKAKAALAA